ncbi:MAG: tetratricopeptide repeat protein [Candidatus Bathyarchaeota archaeon]|nr:tetratricopeptide repeat protein [Candidatus Bathyarchaeota archaeon]
MKTSHVIRDMQKASLTAERLNREGNYANAVEAYNKALRICATLPATSDFDRRRFEAHCYAGLSAAQGKLGKHLECFASANKALAFYDECGDKYPADVGRWLMAQVNQGTALATLGCPAAALEALARAKQLLASHGLDTPENKRWLEAVDANVSVIEAHLAGQQPKKSE